MKKAIIIIVIGMLICTTMLSNVIAEEEFSIHSGVRFGDSKETVLEKETLEYLYDDDDGNMWFLGRIAGIENSNLIYMLDENGKVDEAIYRLASFDDDIKDTLDDKYIHFPESEKPQDKLVSYLYRKVRTDLLRQLNNDLQSVDAYSFNAMSWYKTYDTYSIVILYAECSIQQNDDIKRECRVIYRYVDNEDVYSRLDELNNDL